MLAFVRYFWGASPLSITIIVGVSALTLLLSCLTYYGVEQPLRAAKLSFGQAMGLCYLAPLALVVLYCFYPKNALELEARYTHYDRTSICFDRLDGGCTLGDSSQLPSVLIAGDSHTGHLGRFIDIVGKAEGWSAFVTASSSCPALLDYSFSWRGQESGFCPKRNTLLKTEIMKYPTIILANYWGSLDYHEDAGFVPHIRSTLEILTSAGKTVYLINTTAQLSSARLAEYYLQERYGLWLPLDRWGRILQDDTYKRSKGLTESVRQLVAREYPSVQWVELSDYLPQDLYHEGRPIMSNSSHLNDYGSETLARLFLQHKRLIPLASPHQ